MGYAMGLLGSPCAPAAQICEGGHGAYRSWARPVEAARAAGLTLWADYEVWALFVETQREDGGIAFATTQASCAPGWPCCRARSSRSPGRRPSG